MAAAFHANESKASEAPTGARHDVIVVGAGVIGLSCAWQAARRGLRVCLLDRDGAGAGASAVAAGMLAPVGEASWGESALLDLNLAAARAWPSFADELEEQSELAVPYRRSGALHVALDRDETEELRRRWSLHRSSGLDSQWLRASRCRDLEPGLSTACVGGVLAPAEAAVDPGPLLAALATGLERAGGLLLERAEVAELLLEGGSAAGVRLADGRELHAPAVVSAAGCWAGSAEWLPEAARPPIRPVKGEILTLRGPARSPVITGIVVSERVYLVPRPDGRLIVGATVEERGFDQRVTAGGVHELLREAYRAVPEVAELELVSARAGLRPGSPDNAPLIGRGAIEGLFVAGGHFRNGILLAPLTGAAVAALVAGEDPPVPLAPFDPLRFGRDRVPASGPIAAEVGP